MAYFEISNKTGVKHIHLISNNISSFINAKLITLYFSSKSLCRLLHFFYLCTLKNKNQLQQYV